MKRNVATLIMEVNTIIPAVPTISFRKKGIARYILIFEEDNHKRELGPLSYKEACEFINGIIYSRMEASKILNKQALYISQLEDEMVHIKEQYEARIIENATALHKLFLEKEMIEKKFDEATALLTDSMKTLTEKVASLEYTLEEEAHMHNES